MPVLIGFSEAADGEISADVGAGLDAAPAAVEDGDSQVAADADGGVGGDAAVQLEVIQEVVADVEGVVDTANSDSPPNGDLGAGGEASQDVDDGAALNADAEASIDAADVAVDADAVADSDVVVDVAGDSTSSQMAEGMVLIPAGTFTMGCVPGDGYCLVDEKPQHKVFVSAFYIDVYEVTLAKYKLCAAAGPCTPALEKGINCSWEKSGKEQHPINCTTWGQAVTYCNWVGGRLPTEAEWEKAARGGLDGKLYPWGDETPTCSPGLSNSALWIGKPDSKCSGNSTWAVGAGGGKNSYGLHDMAGNVWEWVNDWFSYPYYGISAASDPLGPATGNYRVLRGGAYDDGHPGALRSSARGIAESAKSFAAFGFRCAKSVP